MTNDEKALKARETCGGVFRRESTVGELEVDRREVRSLWALRRPQEPLASVVWLADGRLTGPFARGRAGGRLLGLSPQPEAISRSDRNHDRKKRFIGM